VIVFYYQENGLLADLNALTYAIFNVSVSGARTAVGTTVTVNMTACPAGHRLGVGRYVAAVNATSPTPWTPGTYEIVWSYRVAATDPYRVVSQRFEVLDGAVWPSGRLYLGYVDSRTAQNLGLAIPTGGAEEIVVANPAAPLYSQTWAKRGADLRQAVYDASALLVMGKLDEKGFHDMLKKNWFDAGGREAADEFVKAYAASK